MLLMGLRAFCLFVILLIPVMGASAQDRVALVVSSVDYQNAVDLPETVDNGRRMSTALELVGFHVISIENPEIAVLLDALETFGDLLADARVGVVYYSGYNLNFDQENHIVPVDARLDRRLALRTEVLPVSTILEVMPPDLEARFVFLDSAWPNPLAQPFRSALGAGRDGGVGEGLAQTDAALFGDGVLIAHSAAPGALSVQYGGASRVSPYTQALSNQIEVSNLGIEGILGAVDEAVDRATSGRQRSWYSSTLAADFSFRVGTGSVIAGQSNLQNGGSGIDGSGRTAGDEAAPYGRRDRTAFDSIAQLRSASIQLIQYCRFLTQFPDSDLVFNVQGKILEIAFGPEIQDVPELCRPVLADLGMPVDGLSDGDLSASTNVQPDRAGNDAASATGLGDVVHGGDPLRFSDGVDETDGVDVVWFRVMQSTDVSISLSRVQGALQLLLQNDLGGAVAEPVSASDPVDGLLLERLEPGSYFLTMTPTAGAASYEVAIMGHEPLLTEDEARAIETALGMTSRDRMDVQAALTALGHDPRGIDGSFGRNTRAAIRRFQQGEGQQETGYLTASTRDRLIEAAGDDLESFLPQWITNPTPAPAPPPAPDPFAAAVNTCEYAYDGDCDDDRYVDNDYSVCEPRTDEADCAGQGYVLRSSAPGTSTSGSSADSCQWAFDGECDEGRYAGSATSLCPMGTDTTDCTRAGLQIRSSTGYSNSCQYAYDGDCDDARYFGNDFDLCDPGTDEADCAGLRLR